MNYAQRLRALADRTGLDGFGDELRAMASEMEAASGGALSPMTNDQVKAMMAEAGYDQAPMQARADFITGIRHCELHHKIGGAA